MADKIATSGPPLGQGTRLRSPVSGLGDPRTSVASQIGPMRAYARALAVDCEAADGFVTTAIAKACDEIDTVAPGTDIRTWLFSTLHSAFHVSPHAVADKAANDSMPVSAPSADGPVTPEAFSFAFNALCVTQREALFLTAAAQMSFSEAAAVCKCSVITMKRRAIEGRTRLAITLFITKTPLSHRQGKGDSRTLPRLVVSP